MFFNRVFSLTECIVIVRVFFTVSKYYIFYRQKKKMYNINISEFWRIRYVYHFQNYPKSFRNWRKKNYTLINYERIRLFADKIKIPLYTGLQRSGVSSKCLLLRGNSCSCHHRRSSVSRHGKVDVACVHFKIFG